MEVLPIGGFDYQSHDPPPGQRRCRASKIEKLTREVHHTKCSALIRWRKHSTITLDSLKAPYASIH